MKILAAASEAVPYAKSGGLGDVMGALPNALARLGHEVKLFIPCYHHSTEDLTKLKQNTFSAAVTIKGVQHRATLDWIRIQNTGLDIYFVKNASFFEREDFYLDPRTGKDYVDNDERFIFFCRAVMELAEAIGFAPDIIHAHDWQAALLPVLLKNEYSKRDLFKESRSVLTIHNLAYQGTFPAESFDKLGLPKELFYPTSAFEFYGKLNFLKAGILHADKITTVSKTYAKEIQSSSELGCGLEGVLTDRKADLSGIVNGVDYLTWSPSRDKHVPHKYRAANLSGKKMTKIDLLNEAGLPVRESAPLIGVISRLVDQKGFDLIEKISDELFDLNIQMILLGTGDRRYHELFDTLQKKYPDKLRSYLTFNEGLAHRIEAASDIFLMPSKFEPCGLNQMYSLKYGTVPVVRKIGGLADTISEFDPATGQGNGFLFSEYDSSDLLATIKRAVETFSRRRSWTKIMKNGMKADHSWANAAGKYVELFKSMAN